MTFKIQFQKVADAKSLGPKITVEPSDESKRKTIEKQKAAVARRIKERA